jgi:plasmid stability protein
MANLTIAIDDEVLKRARLRAVEQGTSVNALLRVYLEDYVGARDRQANAVRRLLSLSGKSKASSGAGGRAWTRDDAYDRRSPKRK